MSRPRHAWGAAALGLTAVLALAGCASASGDTDAQAATPSASAEPLTVVDDQGREVVLENGPAERAVVVGSFNVDLALALGAKEQIVGIDQRTIDQLAFAEFDDSLAVGANGNELNYEAIIATQPDVVLIFRNHGWEAAAEQLEPVGIPVVVLSSWVFSEWDASVDLAARVLGREQEAEEVATFSDEIGALLDRAEGGAASAYYEDSGGTTAGAEGGKNYAFEAAHVENIFGSVPGVTVEADPVAVLDENPDIIVAETTNIYGGTSEADFQAKAAELTSRAGWADLSAVRNGDLFLYNAWAFDLAGNQITPLFYAKWAYPELYEDVEPLEFVERWATGFIGADAFDRADGYVFQAAP